jgi:hypothetical protein
MPHRWNENRLTAKLGTDYPIRQTVRPYLEVSRAVLTVSMRIAILHPQATAQGKERPVKHPTFYRTIPVDGLSIFYREAGPKDAPTLLLLHGLPAPSRMFEPLFSRFPDRYHLVAPD